MGRDGSSTTSKPSTPQHSHKAVDMQYSRIITVLSIFFAFAFVFTSASPVLDTETAVLKRQDADVTSILTKLHTDAVASAQAISASLSVLANSHC